jgi:hypothetical protein
MRLQLLDTHSSNQQYTRQVSLVGMEALDVRSVIPCEFLLAQYLQETFTRRMTDLLPFFECSMQLVRGKVLRSNKLYTAVKNVFTATSIEGKSIGQGSTNAYDSIYTVMNEHTKSVPIHFVRSGGMKEGETISNHIHRRYRLHCYEKVCLCYTDNCCHEYNILTKAIPSLAKFDTQSTVSADHTEILKLPVLYKVRAINYYDTPPPNGLALLERLNACDTMSNMVIGFDAEWDVLTIADNIVDVQLRDITIGWLLCTLASYYPWVPFISTPCDLPASPFCFPLKY